MPRGIRLQRFVKDFARSCRLGCGGRPVLMAPRWIDSEEMEVLETILTQAGESYYDDVYLVVSTDEEGWEREVRALEERSFRSHRVHWESPAAPEGAGIRSGL